MILVSFLWAIVAFAAEPTELWSLKVEGGKPAAVFFDVASGALYVSVDTEKGARLDRVSLEGKLEEKGAFSAKGEAGPLRAYGGKLYWIAGAALKVLDPKGGGAADHPRYPAGAQGTARDISIARNGTVNLAFPGGELWAINDNNASPIGLPGKGEVGGLFVLDDKLFFLRGDRLLSRYEKQLKTVNSEPFCECRWLERTSAGQWLTTKNGSVLAGGRPLLTLKTEIGRPAYVFRMDTTQDFFVLPLPEQGMLRAYRMPGGEKKKKTR